MGKKFMNTVLFLAVTVAAATLTAMWEKAPGMCCFIILHFWDLC